MTSKRKPSKKASIFALKSAALIATAGVAASGLVVSDEAAAQATMDRPSVVAKVPGVRTDTFIEQYDVRLSTSGVTLHSTALAAELRKDKVATVAKLSVQFPGLTPNQVDVSRGGFITLRTNRVQVLKAMADDTNYGCGNNYKCTSQALKTLGSQPGQ